MKNNRTKLMCITGIMTALVFVFTAYLHIPSHTGYTHIGDGFIYIAACILPLPYAAFAGAAGAILADCLTGFAIWAPASAVIKTVAVLFFSRKDERIISPRNLLALLPASVLCIGGYYLYEAMITSNFVEPLAGIAGYVTQCVFSGALYVVLGLALDRLKIKQHILHGGN